MVAAIKGEEWATNQVNAAWSALSCVRWRLVMKEMILAHVCGDRLKGALAASFVLEELKLLAHIPF